ncbi:hypothetical protein WMY93_001882 [Mugilogobius chulae]|uniref:KID domain-containing protein n=1 Tax=Mugilogobius chulae TaxID=88201 RepID=A0AAW0Q728_9GOBI
MRNGDVVTSAAAAAAAARSMKMEAAEAQQVDTAVTQSDTQQITQAQIATLAQVTLSQGHVSSAGPTVTLVQLPNGQTVQVHGVIQAAQPSVIQSPQVQAVQISTIAESEDSQESVDSVSDTQKRREILSRRPSYRKILNDLSSDAPAVPRIEEEKAEEDSASAAAAATPAITTVTVPTPIYQTSSGQYIAITQGGGHPAREQRHRRRSGHPDSNGSSARSHHPAVRPDQRRTTDPSAQQPGRRTSGFRRCSGRIRSERLRPAPSLRASSWRRLRLCPQEAPPRRSHANERSAS